MIRTIEFIETSIFTHQIQAIATDDEIQQLQREFIEQPKKGDLIKGSGGLRKIRLATGICGKSGGARVIYFLATSRTIYLIAAYAKRQKENLISAEKAALKKLTKQLHSEAHHESI